MDGYLFYGWVSFIFVIIGIMYIMYNSGIIVYLIVYIGQMHNRFICLLARTTVSACTFICLDTNAYLVIFCILICHKLCVKHVEMIIFLWVQYVVGCGLLLKLER